MRGIVIPTGTIAAAIVAAACVYDAPVTPDSNTITAANMANSPAAQLSAGTGKSYLIDFTGYQLPTDLAAQVAKAGGTLTASIDQIGVATATSTDPSFSDRAVKIRGVFSVNEDPMVQWVEPERVVDAGEVDVSAGGDVVPNVAFGSAETFRAEQWVPDQLSAPAAWDAGARGAGVRVAILDGGIRSTHLDIAPELDVARSRSFVPDPMAPGTFRPFNTDSARRRSTMRCDSADTFWHGTHVAGIVAAPGGPGNSNLGTVGIAPNATIIGVKVLHCGSGAFSWILNGIIYAATPIAEGGAGADIINMSLGAAFQHQQYDPISGKPLGASGLIGQFCWVFDMVMAPCRGSGASNGTYCWAAGTSMASPAVAGVAALIIGKFGRIGPAAVEARLRASADDLGKPGNDDFYGGGRVNAFRAVQ